MDLDDPELLQRARDGDEAAFTTLYERHRGPVLRFAYRMLNSVEAAEDVAHDCFLALMGPSWRFDPARSALRTYLCAVARNLALKRLRVDAREGAEAPEPWAAERVVQGIADREAAGSVRAAIAALPPLQREVLILVEYEECSLAETAAIVGVDVGTVKARLHRARQTLRDQLARLRPGPARAPAGGPN